MSYLINERSVNPTLVRSACTGARVVIAALLEVEGVVGAPASAVALAWSKPEPQPGRIAANPKTAAQSAGVMMAV